MKKHFFLSIAVITVSLIIFSYTPKKMITNSQKVTKGFAVIELFTSEGCSSCPPADEALEEIQQEYKDKNVLVLGFHVDYWDRLGWKDPFSSSDFTSRQNYYAGVFSLNSIYTPQAVINGSKEFVGSDKSKIKNTIEEQLRSRSDISINLKAVANNTDKIEITYSPIQVNAKQDQLVLLLVQKNATNNIKRGENEGKTLHHINIVRKISYLSIPTKEESFSFNIPTGLKKEDLFIAAFIQNKKDGSVEGFGTASIN